MIERNAAEYLRNWYGQERRKPLVLRGARQVGKSTLVEQFCRARGIVCHEINLERHRYLAPVFGSLNTDAVLTELSAVMGVNVRQPGTLLFLDEVQAVPEALPMLRYLYEDLPQVAVAAAGSLLEFTLADHSFSMPVGRIEYLHLGPCTFKEYIKTIDPPLLAILESYWPGKPFPEAAHRKLLQRLREYLFVGGLPEATAAYCERRSLPEVTAVHRSLVETYLDDFAKYARREKLGMLQRVFRYIPRGVGKKVKYSNIIGDVRSNVVRDLIHLLQQARICHAVHHTHAGGVPLAAEMDDTVFKLIFMDVGLMNHVCGNDWLTLQGMDEAALVNEGAIAEQFVGQHLAYLDNHVPQVFYWLREGRSANAEVDYVVSRGDWILPVEVKAGTSGSLKSLQQFVLQKQVRQAVRFDLNPPAIQDVSHTTGFNGAKAEAAFTLLSLPLYMVEELPRIVDGLRR